jgi:hypothetical protein
LGLDLSKNQMLLPSELEDSQVNVMKIENIRALQGTQWWAGKQKFNAKNIMFYIDMSGYDGTQDLKVLTEFVARVQDAKGFKLKLGGWPESVTFN